MKTVLSLLFLLQSAWSLPHNSAQATTPIVPRQVATLSKMGPNDLGTLCVPEGEQKPFYLHKQVSQTNNCVNADNCGVNHVESNTFGFEVSAGGMTDFMSLGLAVQESVTMGNEYNCGQVSFQSVCIWASVKYLEYGLKCNGPGAMPGPSTMRSPAIDESDNHFYCQVGDACKGIDEHYFNEVSRDGHEADMEAVFEAVKDGITEGLKQKGGD